MRIQGEKYQVQGIGCAHRNNECPRAGLLCSLTLPAPPPLPHALPIFSPTLTRIQCTRGCESSLLLLCARESQTALNPMGTPVGSFLHCNTWERMGGAGPGTAAWPEPWKLWANSSSHPVLLWVSFLLPMSPSALAPPKGGRPSVPNQV